MGKKMKKWVSIALAVVLLASALPLMAGAIAPSGESVQGAPSSGGPLKVEIKSNKDRYSLLGKMEFTATITNTGSSTVENISAQALLGASLRPLVNGSQFTATKDSLAPGASFSFTYYADLSGLKGLDNLLLPVFWVSSLIHGGKADIWSGNSGTDYIEASKTVGLVSAFSGQYDANTTVRVWVGEIEAFDLIDTTEKIHSAFEEINSSEYALVEKKDLLHDYLTELQKQGEIYDLHIDPSNNLLFVFRYNDGTLGGWHVDTPWGDGEFSPNATKDLNIDNLNSANSYSGQEVYSNSTIINERAIIISAFDPTTDIDAYWSTYESLNTRLSAGAYGFAVTQIWRATVADFWKLTSYNIIAINAHGTLYEENPVIVLDEIATQENKIAYEKDRENDNVAIVDGKYYIFPSFFMEHYATNKLSSSLVHMCICKGYANDKLVKAWASAGAKSILAFTDTVNTSYDRDIWLATVDKLLEGSTIEDARLYAISQFGEPDEEITPAYYRLYGEKELKIKYTHATFSTITGKVIEQGTSAPLSGVLVQASKVGSTLVEGSYYTNASGEYILLAEPNTTYNLKFTKAGYVEHIRANVNLTDSPLALSDISMIPSGPSGSSDFAGGSGTATDPYLISTPAQLSNVRNGLTAHYKLINDIDLASWGNWEPIGGEYNPFLGGFDGDGHVIKNMQINTNSSYAGLFASIRNATIKDVGFEDIIFSITSNRGYTAEYAGAIAGDSNSSEIEKCYSTGLISVITSNYGHVGGIVGQLSNSTITNCYNLGEISGYANLSTVYVGGVVGASFNSSISNCYNMGITNASGYAPRHVYAGGIAGYINPTTLNNCYFPNEKTNAVGGGNGTLTNVLALTEAQMKQQSSFVGFDFANVWAISPTINNGYPYLQGMQP